MKVIALFRVLGEYISRKFGKYSEKSVLMEVIDYFRILKTFLIFFDE